jgi:hypothetical protein
VNAGTVHLDLDGVEAPVAVGARRDVGEGVEVGRLVDDLRDGSLKVVGDGGRSAGGGGDLFPLQLADPDAFHASGVERIDRDLLLGEDVVEIHQLMDPDRIGGLAGGPRETSIAGDEQRRARGDPHEVLATVDAGHVGRDVVQSGDGDGSFWPRGADPFRVEIVDGGGCHGTIRGKALQQAQALAGGEFEEGNLGALRHGFEVLRDVLLGADDVRGFRAQHVEENDLDGAGGGQHRLVRPSVGGEQCGWRGYGATDLDEAAQWLGLVVFLDGEVGFVQSEDGVALVVGDDDVDDGLAGVDLEGGYGRLGSGLALSSGGYRNRQPYRRKR